MTSITSPSVSRISPLAWVPVLCGVAVICMESTNKMGAVQTSIWLHQLLGMYGQGSDRIVELLNHYLRKGGHFTGYGILGLFFARGWYSVLRRRIAGSWSSLRMRAGALGVASVFVVGGCDEIHQIFLPTRGASFHDVLLDTSGALLMNLIFLTYLSMRRSALLNQGPFTTLGLTMERVPKRREMRRRIMRKADLIRFHTRGAVVD